MCCVDVASTFTLQCVLLPLHGQPSWMHWKMVRLSSPSAALSLKHFLRSKARNIRQEKNSWISSQDQINRLCMKRSLRSSWWGYHIWSKTIPLSRYMSTEKQVIIMKCAHEHCMTVILGVGGLGEGPVAGKWPHARWRRTLQARRSSIHSKYGRHTRLGAVRSAAKRTSGTINCRLRDTLDVRVPSCPSLCREWPTHSKRARASLATTSLLY